MKRSIIILLTIGAVGLIIFLLVNNRNYYESTKGVITDISFSKDGDAIGIEEENLYEAENFSFRSRESLDVSKVLDSGGEIVVAENDDFGFQIFTMSFSEAGPITTERIQKDLPNIKIIRPREISLGGVEGITFYSNLPGLGETFEAWVVHENKLYQITTSRNLEAALSEILTTWSWK